MAVTRVSVYSILITRMHFIEIDDCDAANLPLCDIACDNIAVVSSNGEQMRYLQASFFPLCSSLKFESVGYAIGVWIAMTFELYSRKNTKQP